jgi:regulatory protein
MAGKITALKFQKKNRDRVSVHIDGRFALGVPAIVAATLKSGQHLSDAEIEALRGRGTLEGAYSRALNYLSYRPRSQAEVTTYLEGRGASGSQIDDIVERLERAGLLDDQEFARYWVENREQFRPRGPRALRYELRGKGIRDKDIDAALKSVDAPASAYKASRRRAEQLSHLDKRSFIRKLVEYLARRGFDYGVAREVSERHWAERTDDRPV